jgi:hypothetical protein
LNSVGSPPASTRRASATASKTLCYSFRASVP